MPETIYIGVVFILIAGIIFVWKARRNDQSDGQMALFSPTIPDSSEFHLTIHDTFGIKGRGLVVVGKIERGTITVGQRVQVSLPDGTQRYETEVRGLEAFHRPINSASTGENIGILFSDLTKDEIKPGMIVVSVSAL